MQSSSRLSRDSGTGSGSKPRAEGAGKKRRVPALSFLLCCSAAPSCGRRNERTSDGAGIGETGCGCDGRGGKKERPQLRPLSCSVQLTSSLPEAAPLGKTLGAFRRNSEFPRWSVLPSRSSYVNFPALTEVAGPSENGDALSSLKLVSCDRFSVHLLAEFAQTALNRYKLEMFKVTSHIRPSVFSPEFYLNYGRTLGRSSLSFHHWKKRADQ
ncbi:uncharacterized protein LOC111819463 [Trichechus manatus latirostris]|uniref:Uncharacterized protein LOC111819463 n=1 Tax=Trichechus manatus latirostris TaxID=127582 RepID=A0A2Y9QR36_TRIMA|nr:uncharacterized protein LOC111819463 [Trichechus manatus latirostris]